MSDLHQSIARSRLDTDGEQENDLESEAYWRRARLSTGAPAWPRMHGQAGLYDALALPNLRAPRIKFGICRVSAQAGDDPWCEDSLA